MRAISVFHFSLLFRPRDEKKKKFFSLLTTEDIDGDEQIPFSVLLLFYGSKNKREKKEKTAMFLHYLFCARFHVQKGELRFENVFLSDR